MDEVRGSGCDSRAQREHFVLDDRLTDFTLQAQRTVATSPDRRSQRCRIRLRFPACHERVAFEAQDRAAEAFHGSDESRYEAVQNEADLFRADLTAFARQLRGEPCEARHIGYHQRADMCFAWGRRRIGRRPGGPFNERPRQKSRQIVQRLSSQRRHF